MSVSRLDKIYRKILLTTFFNRGWGNPDHILRLLEFRKIMSNRHKCVKLIPKQFPIKILNQQTWKDCQIIEGKFSTPLATYLPDIVSDEVSDAYFQLIIPTKWKSATYRPLCIHFAGTGDHYFWRRRNVMAKPLLKSGIAALLLENPFYGLRKPKDQIRSSLHNVSDIFVMGGCLILECLVLLGWCEKMGFGPLGVSGLSMGGHMASLAATNWPKPLVVVPCLSWSTASSVFTEGVMSDAINWDLLQTQYFSDSKFYNMLSKSCTIVDDPFECTLSRIPGMLSNLQPPPNFEVGWLAASLCSFGQNSLNFQQKENSHSGWQYHEIPVTRGVHEYAFDSINAAMFATKSLTPYEVLSSLNSAGSTNCAALAYKAAVQKNNILNLLRITPYLFSKTAGYSEMKRRDREGVIFMRGIMDEFTHLKNFSVPVDTSLVISICARSDAYVPRQGCSKLEDLWPGTTVRYLDSGHVGAYLWHRKVFRSAIVEAFERAKAVCPPPTKFCL